MSALVEAGLIAKSWLATLGMLAVHGSVLALIALVLARAGKLRPSWQAAIWLVVAIKLALPWGPGIPFSVSDLIAQLTTSAPAVTPVVLVEATGRAVPIYNAWPAVGWLALAGIWAVGALIVLVRSIVVQHRLSRAAGAAPAAPADAQRLLVGLGGRRARLVVGAADVGPYVVGLLRPIIVVPPALLEEPAMLRPVLLHELAHVRRADALARVVQIAAATLLWWWPVVRLVNRRLELAREAACDAWALDSGLVGRPAYARLLVRMASLRMHAHAQALAAQHSLDARVAAVLGPPARPRMNHLHRLVLVGFALVALGGARSASGAKRPDVCVYTSQMAAALYDRFPDADLDGDGLLSRDEACGLQATLRDVRPEERSSRISPEDEAELQRLVAEPLCCNCSEEAYTNPETASCQKAVPQLQL